MIDKKKFKNILGLLVIYFLEIGIIFNAFTVYTSTIKLFPWYEPSGIVFLTNFMFVTPLLLLIALFILALRKQYEIPKLNLIIPWVAIIFVDLPIVDFKINNFRINLGICLVTTILIVAIYSSIDHAIKFIRK